MTIFLKLTLSDLIRESDSVAKVSGVSLAVSRDSLQMEDSKQSN